MSRTGGLVKDADWWTFVFDSADAEPPIRLLPNAKLEQMVRMVENTASRIRFVLSGELTVFDEQNYLLPREAMRTADASLPEHSRNQGGASDGAGAVDDTETTDESGPRVASDAPAEEIQELLRGQQPDRFVIPIEADPSEARAEKAGRAARALLLDGAALVNHPCRVIHRGGWWTAVSESDHPDHPEPPLRLLPSLGVEMMVRTWQRQTNGSVFLVSGEVTAFFGDNYLLTRAVRRRIDTGNLRP